MTIAEHYKGRMASVTALVDALPPFRASMMVPGCPDWTVRDLLSHLTALPYDVQHGLAAGLGSDPWTARQVFERKSNSVADLLAEWRQWGPPLADILDSLGPTGWRVLFDISIHEDDLREALGSPAAVSGTHEVVLEGLVEQASSRIAGAGLPGLRLVADAREWALGAGPVCVTLTVSDRGELARILAGRRSASRISALKWDGDPKPYVRQLPKPPWRQPGGTS